MHLLTSTVNVSVGCCGVKLQGGQEQTETRMLVLLRKQTVFVQHAAKHEPADAVFTALHHSMPAGSVGLVTHRVLVHHASSILQAVCDASIM
jgi:hypothetical protein